MDNPWTTAYNHAQDTAWFADTTPQWPAAEGTVWLHADAPWELSTTVQSGDATSVQDRRSTSQPSSPDATEPHSATGAYLSDHQPRDSPDDDPVPDAILPNVASVGSVSDEKDPRTALNPPDDDWGTAWTTAPSSEISPKETQPPDQWEAARQEKKKLSRAVVRLLYKRTL